MQRLYVNQKTIISTKDEDQKNQLATLDDVFFYIEAGCEIGLNIVYEITEGFCVFIFDEITCEFDYVLVKK